jgi:AcrR family transcriptional regulator
MTDAMLAGPPGFSRLDRRKARTRQALVDAAVQLIAEGRGDRASIQEITEAADIGFGSFYNHFDSKDQLFATTSAEVMDRWGQMIDRACVGIADPAEVFAVSFRISGRLGWTHPDMARFLAGRGLDLLDAPMRPQRPSGCKGSPGCITTLWWTCRSPATGTTRC